MMRRLGARAMSVDAELLAVRLLGCHLVRRLPDGAVLRGRIVETEAYVGVEDRACHSFDGRRTSRNEMMYRSGGTAYVYFTYGMHFCMNVVCGKVDEPVAVLVRAIEPLEGIDRMREHRAAKSKGRKRDIDVREIGSGPAKLCQAMAIDLSLNGEDLAGSERLWIETDGKVISSRLVERGARIGVGYAGEWAAEELRFWISGDAHVSR